VPDFKMHSASVLYVVRVIAAANIADNMTQPKI
jgi:hypothetical protein